MPITYPVDELLTQAIEQRLRTLKGAGFRIAIKDVHRPTVRDNATPEGGLAYLKADTIGNEGQETGGGVYIYRNKTWAIDYFLDVSSKNPKPIDQMQSIAIAEIERHLQGAMSDEQGLTFSGLGHSAELLEPQMIQAADGSLPGVRVSIRIGYRFNRTNPFTARN